MDILRQDIRYALRGLMKAPGFTAVAVLTLALGIGANTAMFSVLNAVVLRPLPYTSPEQLAMLWTEIPTQGVREGRSRYRDIEQWRQSRSFADFAIFDPVSVTLTGDSGGEPLGVTRVSPNFFALLGVQPAYGRTFTAEEADQRQRVAVISHSFWQTRYGGSLDAIGASITLDGLPSRIIGILPAHFQFDGDRVWEPHTLFPDWEVRRSVRGGAEWFVIGRLRPDVSLEQAQAEMNTIARRLDEQPASAGQRGISVVPLSMHITGSRSRLALWTLTGAVCFVLLIAVANIAGLSLARSTGRAREIALRLALGASQRHIIRQLLVESLTLAFISALAGLLIAVGCLRLILRVRPGDLARLNEVALDSWVLGWTLGIALLSGVLVGIAPAVALARRNLKPSFQEGARGVAGGATTRRIRSGLVVAEFALAIVLLVGAGLLTRSLLNVQNVDPGFRTERVLSLQLAARPSASEAQRVDYFARVLEQVKGVAGVERAGISGEFFVGGNPEQTITVEGSTRAVSERVRFRRDEIAAEFFETVGTPLIRGRVFTPDDDGNAPRVAILNEAMARRLWSEQDPVNRRFKLGPPSSDTPWFTVVGVVRDMRRQGLEIDPVPQMFEPLAQNPSRRATLLVRTSDEPLKIAGTLQATIRRVENDALVYGVTTLETRLSAFNAQRTFQTGLLIAFSLVALLLASIGIYGLIQYSTTQRTHEIGIRMAVGAQRGDIFRMIVREGLSLSLAGLVVGLIGAVWLSQVLARFLFGVTATDPATLVAVSVILICVALAGCYFPARRAAHVDPLVALRYE